jgi:hypothetical protein
MPLLDSLLCSSNNRILITENCPASPNPAFVDALGRYTALPLIGAAIAANETAVCSQKSMMSLSLSFVNRLEKYFQM